MGLGNKSSIKNSLHLQRPGILVTRHPNSGDSICLPPINFSPMKLKNAANGQDEEDIKYMRNGSTSDESSTHSQQFQRPIITDKVSLDEVMRHATTHNQRLQLQRKFNRKQSSYIHIQEAFSSRSCLYEHSISQRSCFISPTTQLVFDQQETESLCSSRKRSRKARNKQKKYTRRKQSALDIDSKYCSVHMTPIYICQCPSQFIQELPALRKLIISTSQAQNQKVASSICEKTVQQSPIMAEANQTPLLQQQESNLQIIAANEIKLEKQQSQPQQEQKQPQESPEMKQSQQLPLTQLTNDHLNFKMLELSSEESSSEVVGPDEEMKADLPQSQSSKFFICATCKRGPPVAKKYAKNQCQTCYKRSKVLNGLNDTDEKTQMMQTIANVLLKRLKKEPALTCKQVVKQFFKQNPDKVGIIDKKQLRKLLKMLGPPSSRHMGREPRSFNGCPSCKRVGVKHYAKGYCSICYRKMKKKGEFDKDTAYQEQDV